MNIRKTSIIFAVILILALTLRVFRLDAVPLYGDELTMVYDSYSLLQTGQDQVGDSWPLTFKMGAGRPGGYIYASFPFVALFGPSVWGERILSVLSGLGLVVLMFYLGKQLLSKKFGLAAAFLMAISIWDINLSRGGFEAHFALFLTVLGVVAFLFSKTKPYLLLVTALSFGLTIHTYPTYKLTLPLLLILLFWYRDFGRQVFGKKLLSWVSLSIGVLVFAGGLAVWQTFAAGSESRFLDINAFGRQEVEQSIIQKVNLERSISELPLQLRPFLSNKPLEYVFLLGDSYLKNFSLDFLFIHGDGHPRHNMSTMGQFYLIELVLIILGLIYMGKNYQRELKFLIFWIVLAPIPASLLLQSHALRGSLMLPPLLILSAAGLGYLFELRKIRWFLYSVILVFALQFIFFAQRLYFLAPNELGRFWSNPAKVAVEIVSEEREKYDYIFLSNQIDNIEYAYPVYGKVDPRVVISQNQKRSNWLGYQVKKFDNVYIGFIPGGEIEKVMANLGGKALYLGPPHNRYDLSVFEMITDKTTQEILILKRFE